MNLRFPGQYYDVETGLSYNGRRDYESGTGRYVESDPIGVFGGVNTYAYVVGQPLRYVDPMGEAAAAGTVPWEEPPPSLWQPVLRVCLAVAASPEAAAIIVGSIPNSTTACDQPDPNPDGKCSNGGDSCRGLRDQLLAHQRKLREYIANPVAGDNKGFLGQGRDAQVIAGRIRELQKQIANFQKLLEECERKSNGSS
jgi:RHS repeat-associated protein